MAKGHCLDYWHKWKKEYNFCGLRPQDAKENDRYLDLVDKIAGNGTGLDGDFVLEHFTAGAARPLLRCKDDAAHEKALNYVVACLKKGETITGGDLAATINGFSGSTQLRTETPSVPVEKKPAHAFDGIHDGKPVEPPKSLGDQVRKEEVAEAAKNQPVISDQHFVTGGGAEGIAMAHKWTPETCKSGKCPDGQNHTKKDLRGLVCVPSNMACKDLGYCYMIEKKRRELIAAEGAGTGFSRASVAPEIDSLTGGKFIKPGGIRIVKTPLTPDELRICADDLIERSGFFTSREVPMVDELVAAQYEGIKTRADFIKKACNWFMTQAQGVE